MRSSTSPPDSRRGAPPDVSDDLSRLNRTFRQVSARQILEQTVARGGRTILSSSFGPDSAVLLKLASDVCPGIPVVWVDTGYHTRATRRFAEELAERWNLDLRVYRPRRELRSIEAAFGGVPEVADPHHERFAEEVKLEPFRRALDELAPDHWITGIRAEETAWRGTLDVASAGPGGIVKVAPLLHWTRDDVDHFRLEHALPGGHDYHDVVKAGPKRECGLHDRL